MDCILEWRNCSYRYQQEKNVLQDICVKIYEKERIAVIGSNGAGKSTFFLGGMGILRPWQGELLFMGKQLKYTKNELLQLCRQVGLVFQDPDHQMIGPTVEAELSFGPFNMGMPKERVQQAVYEVMEQWGILPFRYRPPHTLSGGEKKQVSLLDILVMKPRLLLMDEPTAFLDGKNAELLKRQLGALSNQGISFMISTHDMDFVWEWARRVIVFAEGTIIGDGTPEEIFADEELLKKAALQKPILYQAAEEICLCKGIPKPWRLPRTQTEFREWFQG